MKISKEEYFFLEWLIVAKGFNLESYSKLSPTELEALQTEWKKEFRL